MRRLLPLALGAAGVACLVIALTRQSHAPAPPRVRTAAPSPVSSPPAAVAHVLPTSVPVSLAIPSIHVQSPVMQLGQAADGSLEVPQPGPHYDDAGWYRYSPTPGALGPAVLLGHVDSAHGGPSVFYRLGSLRPHDLIRVTRADGRVAVFAVDDVQRFAKAAFPTQLVYGNTSNAALRLITCGGPFDRHTGHYLDNVVVRASLI